MCVDTVTQTSAIDVDLLSGTENHVTVIAYGEGRALLGAEHTPFTPDETATTFDGTAAVTDGQLVGGVYYGPSTSAVAPYLAPFLDTEGGAVFFPALGSSPSGEQV